MTNDTDVLKELHSINNRLDSLQADVQNVQQGTVQIKATVAEIKTTVETLEAGQDDIREQLTTKSDKADILNLGVKLDRYQKQNERRFENLEEVTGTHNPNKN